MLDVFEKILKVGISLGLGQEIRKAKAERRDRAAALIGQIADCLVRVSEEIKAGKAPHGSCGELAAYAQELPDVLRDELGDAKAEQLGFDLDAAHHTEGGARDLQSVDDPGPYLQLLDEAAGKFRALSNMLRAG